MNILNKALCLSGGSFFQRDAKNSAYQVTSLEQAVLALARQVSMVEAVGGWQSKVPDLYESPAMEAWGCGRIFLSWAAKLPRPFTKPKPVADLMDQGPYWKAQDAVDLAGPLESCLEETGQVLATRPPRLEGLRIGPSKAPKELSWPHWKVLRWMQILGLRPGGQARGQGL